MLKNVVMVAGDRSLRRQGVVRVVSDIQDFKMPTIQNATSQAGVSVIQNKFPCQPAENTRHLATTKYRLTLACHLGFGLLRFTTTGKSIQNGALFACQLSDNTLNLGVQRDSIRMNLTDVHTLCDICNVVWKVANGCSGAMPKTGVIHLHSVTIFLLMIHELDSIMSTTAIIAPRQEESGE